MVGWDPMNPLKLLVMVGSFVCAVGLSPVAHAGEFSARAVEYAEGNTTMEGWLAVPKGVGGKVPGVLVIHDWTGVQPYSKGRAEQLAGLGYVAMVADIYGKGIRPANPKDSAAEAGKFKTDRTLFRARLMAGLAELKKQPQVDPDKIVAIGYCFGGTGVLELARAGAEVKGVVSFHGSLDSPTPADGKNIKTKVLILHGADDPFVPADGIAGKVAEFNAAKVDWQMVSYSGAVHSFTKKYAGNDVSKGNAYDAKAEARSWVHMQAFFNEVLAPAPK